MPFSSLVQVDVAGLSHQGKVRLNNEDHFLIVRFGRFLESLHTNLPAQTFPARSEEIGYGLVVADGMGGHAAGEEASRLVISSLVNLLLTTPDWILRLDNQEFSQEVMRRARERCGRLMDELARQAQADPNLRGFGSTLTYAVSLGKHLLVVHIGDSRLYHLRQGQLHQLTSDHTLAQAMADSGIIQQQQVPAHHLRHVLVKVLGDQCSNAQPDVQMLVLEDGDGLLLCTDGLTDMVKDKTIAECFDSEQPSARICQNLIDRALDAGGKDNVTLVVARYRFPLAGSSQGEKGKT